MKIAFITGAMRVDSQSGRVSLALQKRLQALASDIDSYALDLGKHPLPMWDEGVWKGEDKWKRAWGPISTELKSCDGIVVIAPEYHGMVPSALKNFLLLAADTSLAFKPGLIVGVSASRNGAYPVAELRMTGGKNTRIDWIAEHLIVREVAHMFTGDEPASDDDKYIRARADYALKLLVEYAKALKQVRDSGVIDLKTYPSGM